MFVHTTRARAAGSAASGRSGPCPVLASVRRAHATRSAAEGPARGGHCRPPCDGGGRAGSSSANRRRSAGFTVGRPPAAADQSYAPPEFARGFLVRQLSGGVVSATPWAGLAPRARCPPGPDASAAHSVNSRFQISRVGDRRRRASD